MLNSLLMIINIILREKKRGGGRRRITSHVEERNMCVVRTLNERFILTICSVYTFIDSSCVSKIKTTQNYYFYIEEEALEKVARGTVKIKHRGAYKLNCLYLLTYLQYMPFKMHTTFSSLICLYVFSFFFYIFQIKYYTSSRRGYFL